MTIDPARRARKRREKVMDRLGVVTTPRDRLQAAYDHLRSAMAVSAVEANEHEVNYMVPLMVETANRLLIVREKKS